MIEPSAKEPSGQLLCELLFLAAPDGILVVDNDGRIRDCNPQIENLFGYRSVELLGQRVETLIPERFRGAHPFHRSGYGQMPRTRAMGVGLELYGLRKDGREFPVDIMLSPVKSADEVCVLAVVRDITDRKEKDEELRKSRAIYEELFEACPDGIVQTDRRGLIARINSRLELMFGYSRAELIGQPISTLIPARYRQMHAEHLERYHCDPRTRPMGAGLKLYGRRKDGSEFPVDIMLSTSIAEGESSALAVVRDDTLRKEAERGVREKTEAIFSSIVGRLVQTQEKERTETARQLRDFNERLMLLSVELGSFGDKRYQLLTENDPETDSAQQQIAELAGDIQSLSHRLHSVELEYLGLAKATTAFCRNFSDREKIEIDLRCQSVPDGLPAETSLCIFRVLQESLRNAAKHSGSRTLSVALVGTSTRIELSVGDSGTGFDPQLAMKGEGLGLITMKDRMKLIGGTLSIDSGPHGGTVIHAQAPLTSRR